MRLGIADNVSQTMISVLSEAIQKAQDVRIAVAFVSEGGLEMLEPAVSQALRAGASLEFLVGLDLQTTEPDALQTLFSMSRKTSKVALFCYSSLQPASVYHPKLYLCRSCEAVTSILGSSNLTKGGLKKNIEVNVVIEGTISDEVLSDAYSTYNHLKFHPKRVAPDEEFLSLYAELCKARTVQQTKAASDQNSKTLVKRFVEKAKSLRHPIPTKKDLVGWLKAVYESLPQGEFTNKQVYSFEDKFSDFYPGNLNVRAKIRQQLQVLRDMGLVEHLGMARWRKL